MGITKQEIIDWIESCPDPRANIEQFAKELNEKVSQLDFNAQNGGAAAGYSGWLDNDEHVQSQLFRTAQHQSQDSQGTYSFINNIKREHVKLFYFAQNMTLICYNNLKKTCERGITNVIRKGTHPRGILGNVEKTESF